MTTNNLLTERIKADSADQPSTPTQSIADLGDEADRLLGALHYIANYLAQRAGKDESLRGHLRVLGETLLGWAQDSVLPEASVAAELEAQQATSTPEPQAVEDATRSDSHPQVNGYRAGSYSTNGHAPSIRDTIRILRPVEQTPSWRTVTVSDDDLPVIAQRCRLKAEGSRWAARRQQLLREGADYDAEIEPNDRDIIARAKMLPECFLWMCHRDGPTPDDLAEFETLANCFEAAADAVDLLAERATSTHDDRELFSYFLELAAEAQSALRVLITQMGGNTDSDQYKIFQWLRQTGSEQQILIRRYMRRDDPADPQQVQVLRANIEEQTMRLETDRERVKRRNDLFKMLRYHLKLIDENRGQSRIHDWQKVIDGVEVLVNDGVPPSNRDLRELLLPVADEMPDAVNLTKNMRLVLRDLDDYLVSQTPKEEEEETTPTLTEDVRAAATLLQGQAVVLIGGLNRPQAADSLTQALQLKELVWVEGRDQTYADFEPYVARTDVAVVILAIRWSRHGFGEVKEFCDKYDKPLVRLPGGYSPNQVAAHIMSQVADRLSNRVEIPV